jgi:hypothetical protein
MFSYLIHGEQVEICGNKLKYFFISMYFNILHYFEIDKVKNLQDYCYINQLIIKTVTTPTTPMVDSISVQV